MQHSYRYQILVNSGRCKMRSKNSAPKRWHQVSARNIHGMPAAKPASEKGAAEVFQHAIGNKCLRSKQHAIPYFSTAVLDLESSESQLASAIGERQKAAQCSFNTRGAPTSEHVQRPPSLRPCGQLIFTIMGATYGHTNNGPQSHANHSRSAILTRSAKWHCTFEDPATSDTIVRCKKSS